ncbi:MAG: OmpA family protein [Alphaproteobacteria bacterium]|jgi:chemotaxis protein MotB|nr:OmpA family protein [Alphaproteobacteria bacterium]
MALSRLGTRSRPVDFTWPGFVDVMASLLMVFVFVLLVFVLIQANLAHRLSGQDASLSELRRELSMLGELLSLERDASASLSADLSRTRNQLELAENSNSALNIELASLTSQLAMSQTEKETLAATLAAEKLRATAAVDKATAKIAAQQERLDMLGSQLAETGAQLADLQQTSATTADALAAEKVISADAQKEVNKLVVAMQSLEDELSRLRRLLSEKERQSVEDKVAIANLGKALNNALANKVQELQKFKSEFFGKLRDILKDRSDVRVVGDRFVFPSEVLFAPGKATIGDTGKQQLGDIANAITDIVGDIPSDIPWVLQIDGHTDTIPVRGYYTDNWDLSTERALSVVRFLISMGVPADKLAATGYGEFQPIAEGNTAEARGKNRRIELTLTQRVNIGLN